MNCKAAREMLSPYLDRELAPQDREAVRMHLAQCDACRTEERDLRTLKGLLLGVRAPEPAADFEQRLMSRLREEAAVPAQARLTWPRLRPLVLGQIAGLAAAATLAFVVLTRSSSPTKDPIPVRREAVAQNIDYDAYADGYDAYSRGDEFAAGSSLLTPTRYGP